MQEHLKRLRDLWNTYVRPAPAPARSLSAFERSYNQWQAVLATLDHQEKNRLNFFIAVATTDAPMKHYLDYIRQIATFCDLCVRTPDSTLARAFDPQKIGRLKMATDILLEAVKGAGTPYLDRVRAEMPVPDLTEMQKYVCRVEIQMLKDEVLGSSRAP